MNVTIRKKPIKTLLCSCCGQDTRGRQWWNQDTGYGLCNNCLPSVKEYYEKRETIESFNLCYGKEGIHFMIQQKKEKTMNNEENTEIQIKIKEQILKSFEELIYVEKKYNIPITKLLQDVLECALYYTIIYYPMNLAQDIIKISAISVNEKVHNERIQQKEKNNGSQG